MSLRHRRSLFYPNRWAKVPLTKGGRLKTKRSALCRLHCQNKQLERDTKRRHSLASVTSSCAFKLKEQNQYRVNVALCPPAPIFPLLMAFLSQFAEFCSHSHQPSLESPLPPYKGLHRAAHDPPHTHARTRCRAVHASRCAQHSDLSIQASKMCCALKAHNWDC